MSRARTFSKMINKANYRTHRGHSAISEIEVATETTASDTVSVISSTAVPALVGMIAPFSMETTTEWRITNRWLICDGSPASRTAYNHLFDVIGTTWGVGDGSSTFNLPDLRGEFLRGFDNGQGNDPDAASRIGGDAVGSSQLDQFQQHRHQMYVDTVWNTRLMGTYNKYGTSLSRGDQDAGSGFGVWDAYSGRFGNETRPRNKYVQYCIKF